MDLFARRTACTPGIRNIPHAEHHQNSPRPVHVRLSLPVARHESCLPHRDEGRASSHCGSHCYGSNLTVQPVEKFIK